MSAIVFFSTLVVYHKKQLPENMGHSPLQLLSEQSKFYWVNKEPTHSVDSIETE